MPKRGDVALVTSHEDGTLWVFEQMYTKAHTEIVRCALWDEQNAVLLTGGEDAKINVWSSPSTLGDEEGERNGGSMDVDSPSRKRVVYTGDQSVSAPLPADF